MKKLFAIITVMLLVAMLTVTASAAELRADLDGDGAVTKDDAIYLLMYTFFPDEYPIPCTEHSEVTDKAVEPTCSEKGLTEGSHCEVCGRVFTAQSAVEKLPHTEGEWTVAKEPTTTEVGKRVLSCSVCGEIMKEEEIPAIDVSGLSYEANDDGKTCTVVGVETLNTTELYIPESIQGYKVTAIGDKAFENCSELTYISIPNTVTSIGTRAFYGCTGLTEFTVPASVTSIGTQIFYKCDNLSTVYYNSAYSSEDNPILSLSHITKVVFDGEYVPDSILKDSANIKEVVIGDSVKSIEGYAFKECSGIEKAVIGNSVTVIGDSAFEGCASLKRIDILDSVTYICSWAFRGCKELERINIPSGIKDIDYYAFGECAKLKKVYITNIDAWLKINFNKEYSNPCSNGADLYLNNELLTEVIVPDTVTKLEYKFNGCTSLKSIELPDSITSIGVYAFKGCTRLESIEIPDSVTSIGGSAFSGCTSLMSVEIPDSVTSIGSSIFSGCTSLERIDIPDSVTNIGGSAFCGCTRLESIEIPDSVTSIGDSAFVDCTSLASVIIGDSVTSIGYAAFSECSSLTSIEIGDRVTSIGSYAFQNCKSLMGIEMPDSVTSIGERAFAWCTSLTSAEIADSVTSIGEWVFVGCTNLTNIKFIGTQVQWEAVSKGYNWNYNISATVVVCTDGDVAI